MVEFLKYAVISISNNITLRPPMVKKYKFWKKVSVNKYMYMQKCKKKFYSFIQCSIYHTKALRQWD